MHCSKCGSERLSYVRIGPGKGYRFVCKPCRAAYMRANRKPLTEEQRRKDNARSYAHVYLKRGKIERKGCAVCGAKAEMHHPDYSQPLLVEWLCRRHHMERHYRSP